MGDWQWSRLPQAGWGTPLLEELLLFLWGLVQVGGGGSRFAWEGLGCQGNVVLCPWFSQVKFGKEVGVGGVAEVSWAIVLGSGGVVEGACDRAK